MTKEIIRKKFVGAGLMTSRKNQKGITLIALIITIIVMLILVGVTVTVALNGGLFKTAKQAAEGTELERDKEQTLSSGQVEIDGKKYASMEDYLNNNPILELADGWTVAETKPEGWSDKVTAITDGTNVIPLPEGYTILAEEGEQTIAEGLVITDGANEFVWIPVTEEFSETYRSSANYYSEPTTLSVDTDSKLTTYYGEDYYTMSGNFDYQAHYQEMVHSVNKYKGFYIGRYETTIDESGNIGSKPNTTVLTAVETLDETYYYRWWGLYDSQRNTNSVVGNKEYVQTTMVWGQQWEAMISYFDTLGLDYSATPVATLSTEIAVVKSGQAKYSYNKERISDEIYNIYDLRRNAYDWTAEAFSTEDRVSRGGHYYYSYSASVTSYDDPNSYDNVDRF